MQFACICFANICLLLLLRVVCIVSALTTPQSSVATFRDRVEMNCSGNGSGIQWTYTARNNSTVVNIYLGTEIGPSFSSRYKIDKRISGQHNLIIDSVDLNHAGRYQCNSPIKQILWNDVQLTVLGSQPVCGARWPATEVDERNETYLIAWCCISFTGSGIPVFNWTKSNGERHIIANTTTSGNNKVSATNTSSIIEQQLQPSDNGVVLHCRITFQMRNNSKYAEYAYTWNYTLSYPAEKSGTTEGSDATSISWCSEKSDKKEDVGHTPTAAFAIGGSILFLLVNAIAVTCVVRRKRRKGESSCRPDVAIHTFLSSYDDIAFSAEISPTYVLDGDHLPGRLNGNTIAENAVYTEVCKRKGPDGRIITGNAVYSEVMKPKGPSKASKECRPIIADNTRQPPTETQNNKVRHRVHAMEITPVCTSSVTRRCLAEALCSFPKSIIYPANLRCNMLIGAPSPKILTDFQCYG